MDKKKVNNILKGAAAAGALYGGANVASGPDVVFAADLEEIEQEDAAVENADTVTEIDTTTTNVQEQVSVTETPAAAAVTGIDVIPQETHINEAADGTDFNNDGDRNDTLDITVEKDEEAIATVDESTIQEGDEGLDNPVKVAEATTTETAGTELTKEEADAAVDKLEEKGYTSDEITVTVNEDATEKAVDKTKAELADEGFSDITETTNETGTKTKISGSKYVDDTEGITTAEKELAADGYSDITKSKDEDTGATTVTGTRVKDISEEVGNAVKQLQDAGYGNIKTSVDDETGKTTISGSRMIDDTYGITSAEKALSAAGCTDISTEKDADGNTIVSGSMLVNDADGIENAKEALKAKGYTDSEIFTSVDDDGNTVVTGSKLVDDTYAIAAAERNLSAAGYTDITTSVDADGNTIVTGSKLVDDEDGIRDAEDELGEKGYGSFIVDDNAETGKTVVTGFMKVKNEEGVAAAKAKLAEAGYVNIQETTDEDGNTTLTGTKYESDEEAIATVKKELADAGYTDIKVNTGADGKAYVTGKILVDNEDAINKFKDTIEGNISDVLQEYNEMVADLPEELNGLDLKYDIHFSIDKDKAGNTVFSISASLDNLPEIKSYVCELKDNGYSVTASISKDGSTEVIGTKTTKDSDAVEAAKQKFADDGYTEISESEDEINKQTVVTANKEVTEERTLENVTEKYSVNDTIIIDGVEYKVTSVEEIQDETKSDTIQLVKTYYSNELTDVNISSISKYNVIALQDFTNAQDIVGSVYVGGTLYGSTVQNGGFIKNGLKNQDVKNYSQSYINNIDSTNGVQLWTIEKDSVVQKCNDAEGTTASLFDIENTDAAATSDYWESYYTSLLSKIPADGVSEDGTVCELPNGAKLIYVQSQNGVATINGGESTGEDDVDIEYVYVVDEDTQYVNVNGIRGVVVAPNADIYLAKHDDTDSNANQGNSAGCVIGKNVYNNGTYVNANGEAITDKGFALELHTAKRDFNLIEQKVTENQTAKYKVTASRTYSVSDKELVNWTEKTETKSFGRMSGTDAMDIPQIEQTVERQVDPKEVTATETIVTKTITAKKTLDQEKATVSQTVLRKMTSDSETVARKSLTISQTVAQKQDDRSITIDRTYETMSKTVQQKKVTTDRFVDTLYGVSATAVHEYYGDLHVDPPTPPTEVPEEGGNTSVFTTTYTFTHTDGDTTTNTSTETASTLAVNTDTDAQEVLGAERTVNGTRSKEGGAVLGAQRTAKTGDPAAIAGAAGAIAGAGAVGGGFHLFGRRRKNKKNDK